MAATERRYNVAATEELCYPYGIYTRRIEPRLNLRQPPPSPTQPCSSARLLPAGDDVMSSEPTKAPPTPEAGVPAATVSNKQRKRDARKAEKAAKYAQAQQKPAAKDPSPEHEKKKQQPNAEDDPSAANYGDVLPGEILPAAVPDEPWAEIGRLDKAAAGCSVRATPRQSTVGPRPRMWPSWSGGRG